MRTPLCIFSQPIVSVKSRNGTNQNKIHRRHCGALPLSAAIFATLIDLMLMLIQNVNNLCAGLNFCTVCTAQNTLFLPYLGLNLAIGALFVYALKTTDNFDAPLRENHHSWRNNESDLFCYEFHCENFVLRGFLQHPKIRTNNLRRVGHKRSFHEGKMCFLNCVSATCVTRSYYYMYNTLHKAQF